MGRDPSLELNNFNKKKMYKITCRRLLLLLRARKAVISKEL